MKGVDAETAKQLVKTRDDHNDFGRWIRNNCKLWEHGTDKVVEDIIDLFWTGQCYMPALEFNRLFHPDIPVRYQNIMRLLEGAHYAHGVDYSLNHPDNCSSIIIELVLDKLYKEHGPDPR